MNVEQFAWRMMELMPQVFRGIARHENNYLTRGQITFPQFGVLEYLSRNGESRMTSVAQSLGISKPATTGIVDRLITQGMVGRRDDPKDRRVVWISITAKGQGIIRKIWQQKHRTLINIFGKISAQDRSRYLNILEQVLKILQAPQNVNQLKGKTGTSS